MSEELHAASSGWLASVSQELRLMREDRFGTIAQTRHRFVSASTISRIENGNVSNLYWRQLYPLCLGYDADPLALLGVTASFRTSCWPANVPSEDDWSRAARVRLRAWRGDVGTPTLARLADVHQSWLVRIESGEYRQMDLLRLHRVFAAIDRTLSEAFAY